ncbi:MAG: GNAT family N-acetyltransferase [Aquabacterium sp.]
MPALCRAFFTPAFALACERAHGRAFVAVLRDDHEPVAFLAFQFAGRWQQCVGLAERIGGELSDNAGLVARPGFRITPTELLRLAGLGVLFISHLDPSQAAHGLVVEETRLGHVVDLARGSAAFVDHLERTNKAFLQETRRRLRRVEREIGPVTFTFSASPDRDAVRQVITEKRQQYVRTETGDPFGDPAHLRLIDILVETADPMCQPVLETLVAGDRVLARHFGLMHAGRLTYWFPVYDLDARQLSPGRLQLWHSILRAEENGVVAIDLGEGDSQAKRDFSTTPVPLGRASWNSGDLRGLLAGTSQRIAWRLQRR